MARRRREGAGAGGVEGTRSLRASAGDARRDGAQPPRASARVPRDRLDPSGARSLPPTPAPALNDAFGNPQSEVGGRMAEKVDEDLFVVFARIGRQPFDAARGLR